MAHSFSLAQTIRPLALSRFSFPHSNRSSHFTCKATEDETNLSGEPISIAAAVAGLISSPVIAVSLYTLKTTGCGLPPGPGGSLGALEGISYLVVAGIVVWSVVTKVRTGSGLPAGPFGLVGASEGLSYLTLVGILVVFGLQIYQTGSLPGPLPSDQCFG